MIDVEREAVGISRRFQRSFRMETRLIVSDPTVMTGKPVIAGTRITVELVLEKMAAGETEEQILETHPRLTREGFGLHSRSLQRCCGQMSSTR